MKKHKLSRKFVVQQLSSLLRKRECKIHGIVEETFRNEIGVSGRLQEIEQFIQKPIVAISNFQDNSVT